MRLMTADALLFPVSGPHRGLLSYLRPPRVHKINDLRHGQEPDAQVRRLFLRQGDDDDRLYGNNRWYDLSCSDHPVRLSILPYANG